MPITPTQTLAEAASGIASKKFGVILFAIYSISSAVVPAGLENSQQLVMVQWILIAILAVVYSILQAWIDRAEVEAPKDPLSLTDPLLNQAILPRD